MKALLLMGSPREGASLRLGRVLMSSLQEQGLETGEFHLVRCLTQGWDTLDAAVKEARLLILSCPLYVDSLPAPTIAALERLADKVEGKKLAVILNCGFPEPFHNNTALKICRQFAKKAGCTWLGGMSLSMGGFSIGKGLSRQKRAAMKLAAQALAQEKTIPDKAADLAAKTPIPKWLYPKILNMVFRRVAKKHGKGPIGAQPYSEIPGTEPRCRKLFASRISKPAPSMPKLQRSREKHRDNHPKDKTCGKQRHRD